MIQAFFGIFAILQNLLIEERRTQLGESLGKYRQLMFLQYFLIVRHSRSCAAASKYRSIALSAS